MSALLTAMLLAYATAAEVVRPPNIVLFVADDVGYDDLGCFGAKQVRTPHLDQLAQSGRRFTSFYAPACLCSASRAALLTGCYAERVGIPGALMPHSKIGLSTIEMTIARLLKQRGYATGLIGKWHLGHQPEFSPLRHGFDQFFGLPYPNDQGAERNVLPAHAQDPVRPPIPLYRGAEVVEHAADLETLPIRFLNEALAFIDHNQARPFFLEFANIETHVPWFVQSVYQGRSAAGPYGDAVEYMDWSVGQLTAFLRHRGLDRNTLFVFVSDNGMLVHRGADYERTYGRFGAVDPKAPHVLRGGKHTVWEGGVRVPCIMNWPGRIPAGTVCHELAAGFDLLPTFARLVGAELPTERPLDGCDMSSLMFGDDSARSPHAAFYYYHSFRLGAVRSGPWKLMLAPTGVGFDGPNRPPAGITPPQLFNLDADLAESTDVAREHPDVVARLQKLAEAARADLGDSARNIRGRGQREPGRVE